MTDILVMEVSLLVLLAVVCIGRVSTDVATPPPLVEALQGPVSGIYEKSNQGRTFASYYGIPYAKPPVGELRFMAPVPGDAWDGVLDGTKLRAVCPQLSLEVLMMGKPLTPDQIKGDEDCLHLNVFTHKTGKDMDKLPVMVWIHGGGYNLGSVRWHPPYVMMNKDIVLVTLHYRLGSLGFLSTEDSLVPGNMGLKDQTLALSWVKQNIQSFGGDPDQVTIFGESAGSSSVHMQILAPHSDGLFQRAIMQSGNALCPWAMGESHLSNTKMLATNLGCTTVNDSQSMIDCLQTVPLVDLMVAYSKFTLPLLQNHNVWGPRVDGDFVPAAPEVLLKEGRFKAVDIIAGVNSHEGAALAGDFFLNHDGLSNFNKNFDNLTPVGLELRQQENNPLGIARAAFDFYLDQDESVAQHHAEKVIQLYSDRQFNVPHESVSQFTVKHKPESSLFIYQLDHRGKRSFAFHLEGFGDHWVSHGDDCFYFFEGGDSIIEMLEQIPMSETDLKIRDELTTMWYNFAKTGNPTPDKSLGFVWNPTDHNLNYLSMGSPMAMKEEDPSRERIRNFWYSLPTRQNRLLCPEKVKELKSKKIGDEL
ncbi:unnamed protein product [Meganyctiphanes norvegica]|uniref:Carboxylic ester hydrolase n=1 Tax=Meganyctiphanes norvegica TaxID=48144 RepID=A0AAV2PQT4_MEGNR